MSIHCPQSQAAAPARACSLLKVCPGPSLQRLPLSVPSGTPALMAQTLLTILPGLRHPASTSLHKTYNTSSRLPSPLLTGDGWATPTPRGTSLPFTSIELTEAPEAHRWGGQGAPLGAQAPSQDPHSWPPFRWTPWAPDFQPDVSPGSQHPLGELGPNTAPSDLSFSAGRLRESRVNSALISRVPSKEPSGPRSLQPGGEALSRNL